MELKTNVNGYDVITTTTSTCKFQTWVRDKEGKAIQFYKCHESMNFEQFHKDCVKRFESEMGA